MTTILKVCTGKEEVATPQHIDEETNCIPRDKYDCRNRGRFYHLFPRRVCMFCVCVRVSVYSPSVEEMIFFDSAGFWDENG